MSKQTIITHKDIQSLHPNLQKAIAAFHESAFYMAEIMRRYDATHFNANISISAAKAANVTITLSDADAKNESNYTTH